ncbi:prefoldin subunit beta [Candidatus Woesearchaeota archaeon]|nr:prefoldin subunit beta [Candidatus Woesearchaeota archaeon]
MSSAKNQLQLLQHNIQNLLMQKQQVESNLLELDSALTELQTANNAYKIVGRIMVAASKNDLQKDVQEKKEVAQVRLNSLEKQEELLKKKFEEAQKEVMKELKKKE